MALEHTYFSQEYWVRWADLDPNLHVRGNVYLDYADQTRFGYMGNQGLTFDKLKELGIGPVMFQLTARYLKEIHVNERVRVNCKLDYLSEDTRKFGISHDIFNQAGEKACEVKTEGAWFDLKTRKIIAPPELIVHALKKMNYYTHE